MVQHEQKNSDDKSVEEMKTDIAEMLRRINAEETDGMMEQIEGGPLKARAQVALMKMQALARQEGGDHYKDTPIEPAQYVIANNMLWADGNVVKYASRHWNKGKHVDVKKIIHYAIMMLEAYYGITTQVSFSDETSLDDLPSEGDEHGSS